MIRGVEETSPLDFIITHNQEIEMRMSFGKYGPKKFPPNGVDVAFINSGYLRWFLNDGYYQNAKMYEGLVVEIQNELKYRDLNNAHFDQDKVIPKKEEVKMTEEFVPMQSNPALPVQEAQPVQLQVTQPPPDPNSFPIEMKAQMELAKVTMDQAVLGVIQRATLLQQLRQFHRIETQEQMNQAIDAFAAAKNAITELEAIRHKYVDFPTKVVDLINSFFKTIRDGLGTSKEHLSKLIGAKKTADQEAANRAMLAAQAQNPVSVVVEPGVGVVQIDAQVPMPGNVVTSERGAKARSRKDVEVVVTDLTALLKALVSTNERYGWLVAHREELIEVKVNALKKLMKDNQKRAVPGCDVKQVENIV